MSSVGQNINKLGSKFETKRWFGLLFTSRAIVTYTEESVDVLKAAIPYVYVNVVYTQTSVDVSKGNARVRPVCACVHAIIQNLFSLSLFHRVVAFKLYGIIKVIFVRTGIYLNTIQFGIKVCFLTRKGISSFSCRIFDQCSTMVRGLVVAWG